MAGLNSVMTRWEISLSKTHIIQLCQKSLGFAKNSQNSKIFSGFAKNPLDLPKIQRICEFFGIPKISKIFRISKMPLDLQSNSNKNVGVQGCTVLHIAARHSKPQTLRQTSPNIIRQYNKAFTSLTIKTYCLQQLMLNSF